MTDAFGAGQKNTPDPWQLDPGYLSSIKADKHQEVVTIKGGIVADGPPVLAYFVPQQYYI